MDTKKYIALSIEVNLFFARIMKEHAIFLQSGFTHKNTKLIKEAEYYKIQFDKVLLYAIRLSNKNINQNLLDSEELITDYTLPAETKTKDYTGICINSKITLLEKDLTCKTSINKDLRTLKAVKKLNCKVTKLLDGLIELKKDILNKVLSCELFTLNYPLLLKHVIHEAELYRSCINDIENDNDIHKKDIKETELFWNEIMMEHTLFIRGLLDPSEYKLIDTTEQFTKSYNELIKNSNNITLEKLSSITNNTLAETKKLKNFKKDATDGILNCKIKSIILPLLADHVLREANHYIRLLNSFKAM